LLGPNLNADTELELAAVEFPIPNLKGEEEKVCPPPTLNPLPVFAPGLAPGLDQLQNNIAQINSSFALSYSLKKTGVKLKRNREVLVFFWHPVIQETAERKLPQKMFFHDKMERKNHQLLMAWAERRRQIFKCYHTHSIKGTLLTGKGEPKADREKVGLFLDNEKGCGRDSGNEGNNCGLEGFDPRDVEASGKGSPNIVVFGLFLRPGVENKAGVDVLIDSLSHSSVLPELIEGSPTRSSPVNKPNVLAGLEVEGVSTESSGSRKIDEKYPGPNEDFNCPLPILPAVKVSPG
ncbi:hypothetical protein pdam_00012917, partial [Pocillopora damicornis]